MELLNISFSAFVHSERALKLRKTATSIAGFGEVDDLFCNSLGMTSLFIIQALSTWLVKIGAFPKCASLRSLASPSAKHD
jgi:hypothetical protein